MLEISLVVLAVAPVVVGWLKYRKQVKELDKAFPPKPAALKRKVDRE